MSQTLFYLSSCTWLRNRSMFCNKEKETYICKDCLIKSIVQPYLPQLTLTNVASINIVLYKPYAATLSICVGYRIADKRSCSTYSVSINWLKFLFSFIFNFIIIKSEYIQSTRSFNFIVTTYFEKFLIFFMSLVVPFNHYPFLW